MADKPDVTGDGPNPFGNPAPGVLARLIKNAGLLLGGKSIAGLLALAYTALTVRALGVEGFGILTLVHTYTFFIVQALNFKPAQAILRYGTPLIRDRADHAFRQLVRFSLFLDLASAALAVALAGGGAVVAAGLFDLPASLVPWMSAYALTALFVMNGRTPSGILRVFNRFDLLAPQSAIEALIRLAGAGLAVILGWGLAELLVSWFVGRVLRGCYVAAAAHFELQRQQLTTLVPTTYLPNERAFHGFTRFVWTTNLNSSVGLVDRQAVPLILGATLGAQSVGLYQIARQIAQALSQPMKSLRPAIYPELARLIAAGAISRLRRLLLRAIALSGTVAGAALLVLAPTGPWLLQLIGGPEAAASSYTLLLLLATAQLLQLAFFPLQPTLISLGRPGQALTSQIAAIGVLLSTLACLIPVTGLLAAGIATLAAITVKITYQITSTLYYLPATATDQA